MNIFKRLGGIIKQKARTLPVGNTIENYPLIDVFYFDDSGVKEAKFHGVVLDNGKLYEVHQLKAIQKMLSSMHLSRDWCGVSVENHLMHALTALEDFESLKQKRELNILKREIQELVTDYKEAKRDLGNWDYAFKVEGATWLLHELSYDTHFADRKDAINAYNQSLIDKMAE